MDSISKNVSAEAIQMLETFWKRELLSVQNTTYNDFRNQDLPLARIKKIMKLDEDVKMISGEAPILFAKAVEMFVGELSLRAWINTEENKRRTLQRNDISLAISKYDQFDFLIDIVPRETSTTTTTKTKRIHNTTNNNNNNNNNHHVQNLFTNHHHHHQEQINYLVQIAQTPTSISANAAAAGQPIQILQAASPLASTPQIIPIPIQQSSTSPSSTSNHQPIPITLSSQQYQQLIQNQQTGGQQILLPTQYITTNTESIELISSSPQTSQTSNNKITNRTRSS